MLTVKQAADFLTCSVGTVYALCSARRIRCSRVGLGRGKIVISDEAISEYLTSREAGVERVEPSVAPRKMQLRNLSLF